MGDKWDELKKKWGKEQSSDNKNFHKRLIIALSIIITISAIVLYLIFYTDLFTKTTTLTTTTISQTVSTTTTSQLATTSIISSTTASSTTTSPTTIFLTTSSTTSTTTTSPTTTTTIEKTRELILTINITKTYFTVGETPKGNYIIENYDDPFSAYVVYTCERENYERVCWMVRRFETPLKTGIFTDYFFLSCEITETYKYCVPDLNFTYPGTYTYGLAVYDCTQIENKLGVTCENADYNDVVAQVPPLNSTEKTVIVTE